MKSAEDSFSLKTSGTTVSPSEVVKERCIGFVFQGFNLLSKETALSNVEMPMIYAGLTKEQRRRRATQALKLVGLGSRMDHKPDVPHGSIRLMPCARYKRYKASRIEFLSGLDSIYASTNAEGHR